MRSALYSFIFLLAGITSSLNSSARELVLVGGGSDYTHFTRLQMRKIFLGYPIKNKGIPIIAIRNVADNETYEVFLQKLIHISAKNYERRLLSNTFRTGSPAVLAANSIQNLVTTLQEDKQTISFMWLDEAAPQQGITVIQSLWIDAQGQP